ncbi:ABC transporter B family member 21-like [Dorcoceras hygrometricum]|uniref:ABC transporter B family member 21-like n=1 Tax=Dorcoceras hygrometricum TaxID=472368 RepID=A0A2Z7BBI5_9LAMI|nr:ABC transporter B family member 21-like [Dorcoceras hygrometricum]
MRIRPSELETSICNVKYHFSLHSKPPPTSSPLGRTQAPPSATHTPPPLRRTCSGHRAEEFPSVLNSSGLLVQADEGVLIPVVDLIRRSTAAYNSRASFPVILVGARRLDSSKVLTAHRLNIVLAEHLTSNLVHNQHLTLLHVKPARVTYRLTSNLDL